MEKIGRNDPCPCGSGKKFKKCCESKLIGKRFAAHKIENATQATKAAGLSNLFNRVKKPTPEAKSAPADPESPSEKP